MSQPAKSHQEIGVEQQLFFAHPYSPGSPFYWPDGTTIFRRLQDLLRDEYRRRDYQEVMSPQLYNEELWMKSGHWDKYRENMFELQYTDEVSREAEISAEKNVNTSNLVEHNNDINDNGEVDGVENTPDLAENFCGDKNDRESKVRYSLKAMNCPGHCLMFKQKARSYRELPLRYADFGCLHRNEPTGSLRGLTRVRKFQQDDAHIFCRFDQIEEEMRDFLTFLVEIYEKFGFSYEMELSTRPEKFLGDEQKWELAENILKKVLVEQGVPFKVSEGEGAFYGPKIDVHLTDSLGRKQQCGTVQLDFVLPERFELEYATEESGVLERPVMIHRAIYGSFERFFALLSEHYQGHWPFWLSPHQVILIPLKIEHSLHALKTRKWLLENTKYQVSIDIRYEEDLRNKIKDAELKHYHNIVVVGDREVKNETVCVRVKGKMTTLTLPDFAEFLASMEQKSLMPELIVHK